MAISGLGMGFRSLERRLVSRNGTGTVGGKEGKAGKSEERICERRGDFARW
jgi:hypothetical protein